MKAESTIAFGARKRGNVDIKTGHNLPFNPAEVGIIGLDESGRKLARVLRERGVGVIAYEPNPRQKDAWKREAAGHAIQFVESVKELVDALRQTRTLFFMGPEDYAFSLQDLAEHLAAEDLVMDASDCYFRESERRSRLFLARNIRYLAVGLLQNDDADGGSLVLAGGPAPILQGAQRFLQTLASLDPGEGRVQTLAPLQAVRFVKMIHDGLEFTLQQLALETFDLLTQATDLDDRHLRAAAEPWLVALPGDRRSRDDARLLSQAARELGLPAMTVDAALGTRNLTAAEQENDLAHAPFRQPCGDFARNPADIANALESALKCAVLITHAQALAVMKAGSQANRFDLDFTGLLQLWKKLHGRRLDLLSDLIFLFQTMPSLPNLLLDDDFSEKVMEQQEFLRHAVWQANAHASAAPALTASLDYLDSFRGAWLPVNLIEVPASRFTRSSADAFYGAATP
jgi:6-phosphogluconate dehydrogenase